MARSQAGYIGPRPTWTGNAKPGIWTLQEAYHYAQSDAWYTSTFSFSRTTVGFYQLVLTQALPYIDVTMKGGEGGKDSYYDDDSYTPCSSGSSVFGNGGKGGEVTFRYTKSGGWAIGDTISMIIGAKGYDADSSTQVSRTAYMGGSGGTVGGGLTCIFDGAYTEAQMKSSSYFSNCIAVVGGGGGAGRRGSDASAPNCGGNGGNAHPGAYASTVRETYGAGGVPGRSPSPTSTAAGGTGTATSGGNGVVGYYAGGGGGGAGNGGGGGGNTCSYCGNTGGSGGSAAAGSAGSYGANGGDFFAGGNSGGSHYGGGGGGGWWGGGAGSQGNGVGHAGGGGGGGGSSKLNVAASTLSNVTWSRSASGDGSVSISYGT